MALNNPKSHSRHYRWFIFDWGANFRAGRLYWGVIKVRPNQKRRDDRRSLQNIGVCIGCVSIWPLLVSQEATSSRWVLQECLSMGSASSSWMPTSCQVWPLTNFLFCLLWRVISPSYIGEDVFHFHSLQQLSCLSLGPLSSYLSWHSAYKATLLQLAQFFWNYRYSRTLSGVPS